MSPRTRTRSHQALNRNRNKLGALYIGLCTVQMLIMAASLTLAHRVENIYSKQISYAAELNAHLRAVSGLRVLADSASPPSVDIVADDWDGEWSRIQYSSELFVRSARQLQQQFESSGAAISNGQQYLRSATEAIPQVVEQTRQAGDALQAKETTLFRTHLFDADRALATLHTALGNLNEEIYRAKDTALARDSAVAQHYRNFIGLLSSLGLFLILPATAYARHLSKEIRAYELRLQAERDTLERRVVERTTDLRLSEERFQLAARATKDLITDWDISRGVMWRSVDFWQHFGYSQPEVEPGPEAWRNLVHPEDRERVWSHLQSLLGNDGVFFEAEYRVSRAGGSFATILHRAYIVRDVSGQAVRVIGALTDLSERRILEEQFRQAQKLESLGRLTGGVAHDFNNLLMVISSYTEMLQERLPPQDPLRRNTQEVLKASKRAANLTQQLLAFSRKQVLSPQVFDLNAVVDETAKMVKRLIGEDIELTFLATKPLWPVMADPGQMTQVLMNLCVNARDAMQTGGKLTIETRNVVVDAQTAARHPAFSPGNYVMLTVSDTGMGMTKEVQERLFEPFFTTKERGKGTGLGLATVYGIVKQSGGYIWVYSEPNNGSCFKVYFPKVDQPVATSMPQRFSNTESHGETILVAEDEDSLRESISEYLKERGYIVLKASDGQQALELADRHTGPIHLLLTDVIMPKISGPDLARRLASRPGMETLFMSGYTDDAIVSHGVLQAGTAFLQKPFSLSTLGSKVRRTLTSAKAEMNCKTLAELARSGDHP